MKKIFRNNRTFNSIKQHYASLKFLFPEYINPNEKLSYEIRKKLLKNDEEITEKSLNRIRSTNSFFHFSFQNLKKNVESLSDFRSETLTRSLGINDQYFKKVPSYSSLVKLKFNKKYSL